MKRNMASGSSEVKGGTYRINSTNTELWLQLPCAWKSLSLPWFSLAAASVGKFIVALACTLVSSCLFSMVLSAGVWTSVAIHVQFLHCLIPALNTRPATAQPSSGIYRREPKPCNRNPTFARVPDRKSITQRIGKKKNGSAWVKPRSATICWALRSLNLPEGALGCRDLDQG